MTSPEHPSRLSIELILMGDKKAHQAYGQHLTDCSRCQNLLQQMQQSDRLFLQRYPTSASLPTGRQPTHPLQRNAFYYAMALALGVLVFLVFRTGVLRSPDAPGNQPAVIVAEHGHQEKQEKTVDLVEQEKRRLLAMYTSPPGWKQSYRILGDSRPADVRSNQAVSLPVAYFFPSGVQGH